MPEFDRLLGTELAGFRLTDALGEGGMAAVFRGENLLNPRIVRAIKVVRPELASREEFRARFMDEAVILEQLRHPNVVGFFGVRQDGDWLLMELELLQGRPLSQLGADVSVSKAVGWLRDACEGVAAAHDLSIVHRDLKPENLFLTDKGKVVVLDFGIARALDDADRMSRATRHGTVPGSPAYMAPEVCNGAVPEVSADVYALGICLYELLLGHHPFEKPGAVKLSSTQMMLAHVKEELPPMRQLRPDVPEALERIIERATAKDPAERFPSARELADALRGIADSLPTDAPTPSSRTRFELPTTKVARKAPTSVQRGSGSGLWIVIGGVVASLAIGGGLVWALTQPPPPDPIAGAETDAGAPPSAREEAPPDAGEPEPDPRNRWVRVDPPRTRGPRDEPLYLGLPTEERDGNVSGFRPSRRIAPPSSPYEIQQHEVTWGELDPWLAEQAIELERPAHVPTTPEERVDLPTTGISWEHALAYCRSLGGTLPTEEQWELAARGEELRPYPWGSQTMDLARNHVYQGSEGRPVAVMTSDQDRTPGTINQIIYDLLGNAQEWTADVWRSNVPGEDESWVQSDGLTFRTVRGLPLLLPRPARLPQQGAAFRMPLCANGDCPPTHLIAGVGFRCVRAPRDESATRARRP